MHPVRQRVRDRLAQVTPEPITRRLKAYYNQYLDRATTHTYSVVAMSTSGPPAFSVSKQQWDELAKIPKYAALSDLPVLLREFYAAVPLEEIYAGVAAQYRRYGDGYEEAIRREVSKAFVYCRVESVQNLSRGGEIRHAVIIPNLMDSYESAFSFVLGDTFYSVEGPQQSPGYNPHEFIHSVTNPLSYNPRFKGLMRKIEPLYGAALEIPGIRKDFRARESFLDENLVRAIVLKYRDTGDPERTSRLREAVREDYLSGFVLVPFFFDELSNYEKSGVPLAEYYPVILRRLDVSQELARWRRERQAETGRR